MQRWNKVRSGDPPRYGKLKTHLRGAKLLLRSMNGQLGYVAGSSLRATCGGKSLKRGYPDELPFQGTAHSIAEGDTVVRQQ